MPNVPISGFTVPANTVGIGLTGYSLTGSSALSMIDLAGTWNTSGTPTALKLNVTDTASNASSLLMDLQVGGSSKFAVRKDNKFGIDGLSWIQQSNSAHIFLGQNASTVLGRVNSSGFMVPQASFIGFTDSTPDVLLTRRGAANLRLGAADAAAPVAQTLSVQSVVAGTTNTAGANLTITGSQGTGTGAGGSIIFQVAPAGSSGTAQNALVDALRIEPGARVRVATGSAAGAVGTGFFSLDNTAIAFGQSSGNIAWGGISSGGFVVSAALYYGFGSSGTASPDTLLFRDAANTLALRNSTNAQTFNVYNTFTSSTNFERFRIFAQSGAAVLIGTEKGSGGGTAQALELQTDGTTRLTISATANTITLPASATLNCGADSAVRFRYINSPNNAITFFDFYNTSGFATFANAATNPRINFGGTTSSFPALKRSSTVLQSRLADDSDFAPLQGQLRTHNAYTAGAPTATGYIVLYDSTGTAYKVPAEAL